MSQTSQFETNPDKNREVYKSITALFEEAGLNEHAYVAQLTLYDGAFDQKHILSRLTAGLADEEKHLDRLAITRLRVAALEREELLPPATAFIHAINPAPTAFMQGDTLLIKGINAPTSMPPYIYWTPMKIVPLIAAINPLIDFLDNKFNQLDSPLTICSYVRKIDVDSPVLLDLK